MEFLAGLLLALALIECARRLRLDRDASFYPMVLVIVATFPAMFAIVARAYSALPLELALCGCFALLAAAGFKCSPWIAVGGLGFHGVLDLLRADLLPFPGAPAWWAMFCFGFDVVAAGCLSALLLKSWRKSQWFRR